LSFDTHAGARGKRVPNSSGPISKWMTRRMYKQHRRKGYRFMGLDVAFLTTIGRRTSEPRETAVAWFPDGEEAWLIVASKAGSARNPDWYFNIAAHPDRVWIELPQGRFRVRPEQLDGAEREEAWRRIVGAQPRYAGYQGKTDRLLPVIRLTPEQTRDPFAARLRDG
jgi:deazaflavin-dependent oxidoreductase (nitroreductase family)